jgi:hypothetical protein
MRTAITVGALLCLVAVPAAAQRRGTGSAHVSSSKPPVTKGGGSTVPSELGGVDQGQILPRHGMFGAPGAAPDALGPSRLGPPAVSPGRGSYGELATSSEEPSSSWRSGDRVRSLSSADVRAARQQQAPDLEWASGASGPARPQPQKPHGTNEQQRQHRPAR